MASVSFGECRGTDLVALPCLERELRDFEVMHQKKHCIEFQLRNLAAHVLGNAERWGWSWGIPWAMQGPLMACLAKSKGHILCKYLRKIFGGHLHGVGTGGGGQGWTSCLR